MSGFRGVDTEDDLKPGLLNRKPNEFKHKAQQFFTESAPFMLIASGVVILIFPITAELLFFMGIVIFRYANNNPGSNKVKVLPITSLAAISKTRPLLYSKSRFKREKAKSKGHWCLGTTVPDYRHQYVTNGQMLRHLWIAGSTGSGKTQFILALVYQALVLETGCLLVDAKGSNATFWHFYSIVRRFDRVEDLLLFNFLSASLDNRPEELKGKDRVTNTLNFMELGSAEELRSLFGDLLQDTGAPIWKGKAKSLLYLVLLIGTQMRDRGEATLSVKWLRSAIQSTNIVKWATEPTINKEHQEMCRAFLTESGGFRPEFLEDPTAAEEDKEFNNQWSYITMQMTESLQMLEKEFAGIFGVERGEIDFSDLVLNRRLGFGILPTLEKDKETNGILARLILANLRKVFAAGIGSKVQGNRTDVIDNSVTNYGFSFLVILDEYVQYGGKVKGFGAAAAMARSMGVCLVFAGQQEGSLAVESKEELVEIIGNTQIKVGMLIEEEETALRFIKRAGETFVAREAGMKRSKSSPGRRYVSEGHLKFEKESRINMRDLTAQEPGEAHTIIKDDLTRLKVMAALADNDGGEIKLVNDLMLNHLLCIAPPSDTLIDKVRRPLKRLNDLLNNTIRPNAPDLPSDPKLTSYIQWYRKLGNTSHSASECSFAALAAIVDLDPSKLPIDESDATFGHSESKNEIIIDESTTSQSEEDELELMLNRKNSIFEDETGEQDVFFNVSPASQEMLQNKEDRIQELHSALDNQLVVNLTNEWSQSLSEKKGVIDSITSTDSLSNISISITEMLQKIDFYGADISVTPMTESDLKEYVSELKGLINRVKEENA